MDEKEIKNELRDISDKLGTINETRQKGLSQIAKELTKIINEVSGLGKE